MLCCLGFAIVFNNIILGWQCFIVFSSTPAIKLNAIAASSTDRANGPVVSKVNEDGITPLRLVKPVVGLIPTRPVTLAGPLTEADVSVPKPNTAKFAVTAAAVPLLDPEASRLRLYGFNVKPPKELYPSLP